MSELRTSRPRHAGAMRSRPGPPTAFSIALTAPPRRQSGCRTSAWPGRPGTRITPYSEPAAGDPHLKARRLGHDPRVGGKPMLDKRGAARARGLLIGVGRDQQVAGQTDRQARQDLDRAAPSPRSRPSCHTRRGRRASRRALDATNGSLVHSIAGSADDHVDVAVEHQRAPAATTGTVAISCGHPAKSKPGGTSGFPAIADVSGSHTSTDAPTPPNRAARYSCSATSSRQGSPTARAVVSNPIKSLASSTSDSRPVRNRVTDALFSIPKRHRHHANNSE